MQTVVVTGAAGGIGTRLRTLMSQAPVPDRNPRNPFSFAAAPAPHVGTPVVRAAYSSGKPAYGVGPGNAPAYIERTANVKKAVSDVVAGKTFDNGVLCS